MFPNSSIGTSEASASSETLELSRGSRLTLLLVGSVGGFLAMVAIFWVGFLGSDDTLYWQGAGGWLSHFPYLGSTHWTLRHPLVIPMAITRALLGGGLPALVLPSLLYAIGVVVLTAVWIWRAAGMPTAVAAMALIVTAPQFVLLSSVANIDVVEMFFVLLAFVSMHSAMEKAAPVNAKLLLLAGVSCGMAMLARETAAFALVAIGALFLAGFGMKRMAYVRIGFCFAGVVISEFLYLFWMSGKPFYRSAISLHHDNMIDRWVDQGVSVPLVHPAIDPITMLLLNHNFGLLAWIGVPLAVWLMRRGSLNPPAKRLAVMAITLAITWTAISAGLWNELVLEPRYYLLPQVLLAMVSGIALAELWHHGRRTLAASLATLLVAGNLLCLAVDNRNYMYGEYVLADMAARQTETIHTDPQTLRRATLLLRWESNAAQVTDTPPGRGDLFFANPARRNVIPGPGWIALRRCALPPTIGQRLVSRLLPPGTISPSIFEKLGRGHPDVTLYRLP